MWSDIACNDYLYWQTQDKKTLKKIYKLILSIEIAQCRTHYGDK